MTHEIPGETPTPLSHPDRREDSPTVFPAEATGEVTQPPRQSKPTRRIGFAIAGLLLLGTVGFFAIRAGAAKPDKENSRGSKRQQVTPVMVATVTQKTVPIQLKAIGTVQAESTVSVTPQAGGQIVGVHFKKGQDVQKGQLLFSLDDRTQLAAIQQAQGVLARDRAQVQQARATLARDMTVVRQAQATLAKDQAQAQFAQAQNNRYSTLYKQGAVSQDQAQQYQSNSKVSAATLQADREAIANAQAALQGDQAAIANAEAVVRTDEAALQAAEVQLSYTKIYAPISGRAGNILVTEGNVVQANNSNALVAIAQVDPIQVSFSVPESNLAAIQKYMDNGKLKVDVTFSDAKARPIRGTLSFLNNTVDNTTGTIQLIGDFDNRDGKLFPGQYVNATLTLTQQPNAIVVPSQAVQNGPNGQFVFVADPDEGTVENVPVTVTTSINGLDVVQKGLSPGDQVVTDGQANLVDGGKIRIKTAGESGAGDNSGNPDRKSESKSGNNPDNQSGNQSGNQSDSKSNNRSDSGSKRNRSSDRPANPAGGN